MPNLLRPRLVSIDVFASALLVALGVHLQSGCGATVDASGSATGSGGSGAGGPGSGGGTSSASTSGSMTTSGSMSTSVSSSSGAGGALNNTGPCGDPKPVLVNGMDTGLDLCAGGQYRRREAIECPTNFPDTNPCCGGCPDGMLCDDSGEIACSCVKACTNDAQCPAGQLCMCGDPAGLCVDAKCTTDADCGPDQACTSWDKTMGCLYLEFACTTPGDTCGGNLDCGTQVNTFCSVQPDGTRQCVPGGCAIGRPFLVDDEARTAPLVVRSDWAEGRISPNLEGISDEARRELAEAWERIAQMEHASIAAFARSSLQLLSLGAPPDLIERTNRAMIDETRHARAAFALASAYRMKHVGPGKLSADGALDGGYDVATIISLVIREGCVGETVAALEAGEASASAIDPVVQGILAGVAGDESEHAELAWRTVQWALEAFGAEVHDALSTEIAALEREIRRPLPAAPSSRDEALFAHGVVTDVMRSTLRRAAIERVILPCLRAITAASLRRAA